MSAVLARLVYRNPAFWPSIAVDSRLLAKRVQPELDRRRAQRILAQTFEQRAAA